MTDKQKNKIIELRNSGASYSEIAEETHLSKGTIKSFLSRMSTQTVEIQAETNICKYCGAEIINNSGRVKIFCSEKCKAAWWSRHYKKKTPKKKYKLECECCGKNFEVTGRKTQKYCSHECYINARFGGVACG